MNGPNKTKQKAEHPYDNLLRRGLASGLGGGTLGGLSCGATLKDEGGTLKDEGGTLRASASSLANALEALEERLSDVAAQLFPCDANSGSKVNGPVPSMPELSVSIERAQNTTSRLHGILNSIADRL